MRLTRTLQIYPRLGEKKLLFLISIIIIIAIIDSEIGFVSDFLSGTISSSPGIALFISFAVIFAVAQYFILAHIKSIIKKSTARPLQLSTAHKAVTLAQYALVALAGFVLMQMITFSHYYTIVLYPVILISSGVWIVTLALLSRALLSWYRTRAEKDKKSNALLLTLTLAMLAYVVLGIVNVFSLTAMLQQQQSIVTSTDVAYFPQGVNDDLLTNIWYAISTIAYVLNWIGTVLLLHTYVRRIGKIKFWILMGGILVYYLASFPLNLLGFFVPVGVTDVDVMNNIIVFSVAAIFAGILFGIAFLSIARTLDKGSALRNYFTIAAYGMVLFYITLQAQVSQAAYAPFGLVSSASVGISTLLIYLGLYWSAVTVSLDSNLRRSIRKSVMEQSKLLDRIGTAEMETELQKKVLAVAKKTTVDIAEKTGVEVSLNEDDMRTYVQLVIKELHSNSFK